VCVANAVTTRIALLETTSSEFCVESMPLSSLGTQLLNNLLTQRAVIHKRRALVNRVKCHLLGEVSNFF